MIDFSQIKRIDRNAPGSFAELRRLQQALGSGDFDALGRLLEAYGVDVESLAIAELEQVVRHIIGEPSPLPETNGV